MNSTRADAGGAAEDGHPKTMSRIHTETISQLLKKLYTVCAQQSHFFLRGSRAYRFSTSSVTIGVSSCIANFGTRLLSSSNVQSPSD